MGSHRLAPARLPPGFLLTQDQHRFAPDINHLRKTPMACRITLLLYALATCLALWSTNHRLCEITLEYPSQPRLLRLLLLQPQGHLHLPAQPHRRSQSNRSRL